MVMFSLKPADLAYKTVKQKRLLATALIDPNMLAVLSQDADVFTRKLVALNPNTSAAVLTILATDPAPDIRAHVACHLTTPSATLSVLSAQCVNTSDDISLFALTNPNFPVHELISLVPTSSPVVLKAILSNPNTPAEILVNHFASRSKRIRERVAAHPNTPVALLSRYVNDHRIILEALAGNPNTPPDILIQLAVNISSFAHHVPFKLVNNPSTPDAALKLLTGCYSVALEVEKVRMFRLQEHVKKYSSVKRNLAVLILPSFTGFRQDLDVLLTSLI